MNSLYRRNPPLFGKALRDAINATPSIRPVLIEDFVLEESVMMVSAKPGCGKTCLLLTVIAQGTLGLPVFGHLPVPHPLRIYIGCPERKALEIHERLKTMQEKGINYDENNLCIDDGYTGLLDISNELSAKEVVSGAKAAFPNGVDLVCFEGMYGMTKKPLSSEEAANEFYRFNAMLIATLKCSIWYSHHTKKTQHDKEGNELPDNWFGSQFLMANVTAAYLLERVKGKRNQSRMKQQKDTVSGIADELIFDFDPETFTLTLDRDTGLLSNKERLRAFVNSCYRTSKTFTYDDLSRFSDLSHSTIARAILAWVKSGAIKNTSGNGHKGLYSALAPV